MAKLKDRREAHRVIAKLIDSSVKKLRVSKEVLDEIGWIRASHFLAGSIEDDLPDDHEVLRAGELAHGGVYRCQKCGAEVGEGKKICLECNVKSSKVVKLSPKKNGVHSNGKLLTA